MMTLYEFSLSHFCEKARWALDYHGLTYQVSDLFPGLHRITTTFWGAPGNTLPLLVYRGRVIQGSGDIITHLDQIRRGMQPLRPPLTPRNSQDAKRAAEIEKWADEEIGVQIRRVFYGSTIDNTEAITKLLMVGTPRFFQPFYRHLFFPIIRFFMKREMQITPPEIERSKVRLAKAMDQLRGIIKEEGEYLVGGQFSRADIAVASLLGFFSPRRPFPFPLPESAIQAIAPYHSPTVGAWVDLMYERHRPQRQ